MPRRKSESSEPLEVEVTVREEGESGITRQVLTQDRIEAIAEWLAAPASEKTGGHRAHAKTVMQLARRLKVDPALIRRAETDPRVFNAWKRHLQRRIMRMLPDAIDTTYKLAMGDLERGVRPSEKSLDRIFKAGGLGPESGVTINSTTLNLNQGAEATIEHDERILARLRLLQASGYLKRLAGGADATSGTQDPTPH